MVREGVTSFKMFMAYPGVFLVDDQQIFRAMLRAGELGALITMHAEIGLPIDVLVQRALAEGHTAPVYHALTRPEVAEATGTERAIALAEMAKVPVYMVHLSAQRALERVMEARDRGLPAYAETCPQYLFCSRGRSARRAGQRVEGRGVRVHAAAAARSTTTITCGAACSNYDLQVVATDHCPFCMKDQKELGRGDFSKIPNGMPGVETRLHLLWEGVRAGQDLDEPLRRDHVDGAGEDLRHVRQEGHARGRRRCRRRRVGSRSARSVARQGHAAHARRLLAVRGPQGPGQPVARALARRARSSRTTSGSRKQKQGRGQFLRRGTFGL